ncbi:MAG: ABC transporter permease [Anaerolineae bacterium]|nr:ABC transporter permease [Anaerolineae bacterium]
MVHLIPGDPVKIILGPRATAELSERVRREMLLDQPVPTQIFRFIGGAVQGDLGMDFLSRAPVRQLLGAALPHTVILALAGLGLAALIGIPLGVYSAVHRGQWADTLIGVLSVSLVTMPSYVLGLLLLLVFAVQLRWFPAIGVGELSDPLDYLSHLVLPALALAITWVGYLARLVRASMLEVISSNHIRAAFAMGLPARLVYYKYALRNALIPTVAVLGVGLGNLLGGAIFVEVIFTRPGLGRLILDAITTRNYTVVRGGVLVAALLFVLANLIADLANRYLDPRTRS